MSGTEVSAVVSSPAVARPEMAAVVTPQAMPKAPNAVEKPEKKEAGGTPDEAVKPVSTKPQEVTAIGDSVILDAAPYLKKLLPGILVDGKVGRQMREAQDVVEQLEADGNLGSRVIIELGTNGTFTGKQMEKLIQTLGEERIIVLVNTRVPRPWQDPVNEALKKIAAKHDNVTLVNWHSFSAGKSKFFAKDGVHLQPKGASAYASLVAEAVNKE